VNSPRALFSDRTGRQPLYHIAIEELQEWTYAGEPLVPLKGFPGVVWSRPKKTPRGVDLTFAPHLARTGLANVKSKTPRRT
jgi:hypothetical protein